MGFPKWLAWVIIIFAILVIIQIIESIILYSDFGSAFSIGEFVGKIIGLALWIFIGYKCVKVIRRKNITS
jgi:hypothetical protein